MVEAETVAAMSVATVLTVIFGNILRELGGWALDWIKHGRAKVQARTKKLEQDE